MLNFGLSTRPAADSIKAEYTHQAWEEIGWMEAREKRWQSASLCRLESDPGTRWQGSQSGARMRHKQPASSAVH